MADIKIYFLKKEINKIKENLNINLDEVKEDFKKEAKKNIENFINFLDNALTSNKKIDNIITDINSKINSFNDKINDIMKKSMDLNPMVNVMPDLSADDFYEVKTFAENIKLTENEYFNKFADNENINDELLDRIILLDNQLKEIEKTDKSDNKQNIKNLYKERAEIYNSLSMPSYAIEDCNKAIEIDANDINLKLLKLDILKKGNEVNADDIIKCYYDIINLNKNNLESYYKKIEYLESLVGRQEEIINCCNEILNIDSNNIKALYIIADEYRKQADKTSKEDDYKKALEYYNKVKSLDKNYNAYYEEYCLDKINYNENLQKEIKYYYDKAEAFFELGRHKEAINCADKAVSLDEKYYKSYYFKGSLLKNIENYDEAIVCFDKAIEINNKDTDSYYNKAIILFELGRYEEAEKEFNNITKLSGKNYNSYYKGLTLYRERKYAEALNEFDEAIKLNNNYNNEAYYYKGLCLYNLKKYDEALESFKSTNNFNKYDMYYFLGEIYETKNNYKEAFKYYDEALKNYKEKNNARDYYIIAMTLYKLSLFYKAMNNFNKALSFIFEDNKNAEDILNYCNNILNLEKNNKVFYAYKIIALILLNKYDEALSLYNNIEKNNESLSRDELYQKALNILDENKIDFNSNKKEEENSKSDINNDIESLKEQINLLKSKGENYLVMEWYDKIIEANNQNIESYREKIEFAKSIGNSKAAIECYDKMMKLSPIEAYKGKAEIYRTLANENDRKYYDLAIECYDNVIELNLSDAEAYKGKADTYYQSAYISNGTDEETYYKLAIKYYDKAIECYDNVIELNLSDAEAYKGKADIYYQLAYIDNNRPDKIEYYDLAIEYYDKAIELNPNDAETYKGKADACCQLAKNAYNNREKYYDLAIEYYDKAIELNLSDAEAYKGKADIYYQLAYIDNNRPDKIEYYDLAIEYYDKAIELNPNDAETYKGKADACCQLAKNAYDNREKYYDLAIEYYDKAIELKPSSELYSRKADTLSRLDRESEAYECGRKAVELKKLGK